MRYRFIEAEKAYYPVQRLCRLMPVSRSGFYAWRTREPSARARRAARALLLLWLIGQLIAQQGQALAAAQAGGGDA